MPLQSPSSRSRFQSFLGRRSWPTGQRSRHRASREICKFPSLRTSCTNAAKGGINENPLWHGLMAQFSGAVKLADLNDFIAPSQACIVNVDGSKRATLQLDSSDFDARPEARTADHHLVMGLPCASQARRGPIAGIC